MTRGLKSAGMPLVPQFIARAFDHDAIAEDMSFALMEVLFHLALILVGTSILVFGVRRLFRRAEQDSPEEHPRLEIASRTLTYLIWGAGIGACIWRLNFDVGALWNNERSLSLVRAVVVLLLTSLVTPIVRRTVLQLIGSHWSRNQIEVARRGITYVIWGIGVTSALKELNFDLTFLLGAAGAASVALSLAAQNSTSQLINGFSLLAEQAFVLGDVLLVQGITGEVLSIDLLSVKLRTPDNLLVRIPNTTMLQAVVTNNTAYPIRRNDIEISVAYQADIGHVSRVLFEIAERNPLVLDDPKPLFIFTGYGNNALQMNFCVWGRRESFLDMKNSMYADIKATFDREGIEMPFPQRALSLGNLGLPLKIEVIDGKALPTSKTSGA